MAFKRVCDASGCRRLNEAVEGLMLKCIDAGSLGLLPTGDRYAWLICRANILKKMAELRKKLGWEKNKAGKYIENFARKQVQARVFYL